MIFNCYEGEEIDDVQIRAYEDFMANWKDNMDAAYRRFEEYCAEEYPEEIGGKKFENIFKFLKWEENRL